MSILYNKLDTPVRERVCEEMSEPDPKKNRGFTNPSLPPSSTKKINLIVTWIDGSHDPMACD